MILNNLQKFDEPKNLYCSVGVAVLGSAAIGAASTAYGASKAASAQTSAANTAAQTATDMYGRTRKDLKPYREAGARYSAELEERMPFLTSPIEMTQENLEKTPGYQFTKTQGLKAVQNAAAARGLGVSGAALKGASTFATGLANQTYKDQFALENTNRTNAYERLKGLVTIGQNAAAQTGTAGTAAANTAASAQMGAGNAEAAMYNAIGGAGSKFATDVGGYAAYKGLYGSQPANTNEAAGYNWNGTGFAA